MEYKAYTYLLKFKPENKFYYGVRFKNVRLKRHPAEDFMINYTTSSEQINELITEHGLDAFEWEIRKTFDTAEQAIAWETKVLNRAKVLSRQHIWFNANIAGYKITTPQGRKRISERHTGVAKTEEHKEKIRASNIGKNKGKTPTEEHRRKNSEANSGKNNPRYGVIVSEETCKRISAAKKGKPAKNKGIPMSEEQKAAIRDTKAATKTYLTCEHCSKTVYKPNYFQHHADRCKQNPNKETL